MRTALPSIGRRLAALLALSLMLLSAASGHAAPLDAAIAAALKEEGLTGALWSTVTPDGGVSGAAGLHDAASARPMTTDSKIKTGSVAKTVLAMGVLKLISNGQLSLDTPVAPLLPQLRFDNPWQASHPLLVRHLLAHTAGLDNMRLWQVFTEEATPNTPLAAAFPGDPSLLRVRALPGSRYNYSSIGYTLLGMVIEEVSKQRYEAFLDTELLQPLGMRDSSFAFLTQGSEPRLAMGHFEHGVTSAAGAVYLRPAEQFSTTAPDMARFARFLLGDGSIDGARLIDPALMRMLAQPQATEAAVHGLASGHGLALATRDRHGLIAACHPGTGIGFRAMLCLFPAQQRAFFIAFNTDSETANYERFNRLLIDSLGMPRAAAPPTPAPNVSTSLAAWDGRYVPAPNALASLEWVDMVFAPVKLRWNGKRMILTSLGADARQLIPLGGGLLRASDRTAPSHVLYQTADGQRVVSDGLHTWEQRPALLLWSLWLSLGLGLAAMLYVLLATVGRMVSRGKGGAFAWPFVAMVALALPIPLFYLQSVLALGDMTIASVGLAIVTGLLPLAVLAGLWRAWRRRAWRDGLWLLAIAQLLLVLAWWGMLPFRLWH